MQVIRAKVMGYCFGVQRAIDMALCAAKKSQPVFTFGPLIHNQTALDFLIKHGVREFNINAFDTNFMAGKNTSGNIMIIRAHGAEKKKQKMLEECGFTVLDATCPRVKASQELAQKYSSQGAAVLIAGDKEHGEVIGIASFADSGGSIVEIFQNADEVRSSMLWQNGAASNAQYALIAQTTIRQSEYEAIAQEIKKHIPEQNLSVCATICPATKERQEALEQLCAGVDGVLVIGGKDSANTKRLLHCAISHEILAALISSEHEIPAAFFAMQRVGLTAGASTPNEVIDAVEARLMQKAHPCA